MAVCVPSIGEGSLIRCERTLRIILCKNADFSWNPKDEKETRWNGEGSLQDDHAQSSFAQQERERERVVGYVRITSCCALPEVTPGDVKPKTEMRMLR